jgi:hypothetical protein
MPRIDAPGSSGAPGETLTDIWVSLTLVEADELLGALRTWANDERERERGWHCHIADADGRELTIVIDPREVDSEPRT